VVNVGVIGLGHMGRLHMMNCLHIDDVNVVAAAYPSKKALKKGYVCWSQESLHRLS